MNAWEHLSNARHIDWVLESMNKRPEIWVAAYDPALVVVRGAARDAAWGEALTATDDANRYAAWNAARDTAFWSARDAYRGAVYHAARDAICALIAYDDCEQYLSMTSEELKAWALMTEYPAAVLLLPMVVVREQIEQTAT